MSYSELSDKNHRLGKGAVATRGTDQLKSMAKMLRVLECFSTVDRHLSVSDIVRITDLPRATAHRIAVTMRDLGFLDQDKERDHYRLGLKLFEFGSTVLANMDLHREATPFADALKSLTGETVNVTVFNGTHSVVISRLEGAENRLNPTTVLTSTPAHCSASGKVALAFQSDTVIARVISLGLPRFTPTTLTDPAALRRELATIRKQEYAIDDNEHQPGCRCVAAPIRDSSGRTFAAISITGAASRITLDKVPELAQIVMHQARLISTQLGHRSADEPRRSRK
jgi:DNA-binding IclR family transcriptional regulator